MPSATGGPEPPAHRSARDARGPSSDAQPHAFVLDDDVPTAELLCEIAREEGWEATGFARIEQLRESLGEERPALIIVDDDLPDGRGGDLVRELRDDPATDDLPVVLCTGAHPMRQAELGAWAPVVGKPFEVDEIVSHLAAAARRHDARRWSRSG